MTKPAARMGDKCSGHPPYKPRASIKGSPNVFFNSKPAHRKTDTWMIHCSKGNCHPGITVSGSPTVLTNGLPQARVGDKVNCKSIIATGSPNIFIGGGTVSYSVSVASTASSFGGSIGGLVGGLSSEPFSSPMRARTLSMVLGTNSDNYSYTESFGWAYGPHSITSSNMGLFLDYIKKKNQTMYDLLIEAGGVDGSVLGTIEFQMVWDDLSNDNIFIEFQNSFNIEYQYILLYQSLEIEGYVISERLYPVVKKIVDDLGIRTDIFINTYNENDIVWLDNIKNELMGRLPNGLLKNYQEISPKEQFQKYIELDEFFRNLKDDLGL